jgi:hypothetical protein
MPKRNARFETEAKGNGEVSISAPSRCRHARSFQDFHVDGEQFLAN